MSRKTTRLEDIARLAGVSIATASRALNDSPAVNDRTKQTIWKLAKEHDYPFRRHMPAGPIGAQGTIALVVPRPQGREGRLSDPFFLELLAALRRQENFLHGPLTPSACVTGVDTSVTPWPPAACLRARPTPRQRGRQMQRRDNGRGWRSK